MFVMSRGRIRLPVLSVLSVLVGAAVLSGGCASNIKAQWTDPQFAHRPLRGASVLVQCEARETAVQRICVEQMSEQLRAVGAAPVVPDQGAGQGSPAEADAASEREAARQAGAQALLTAKLVPGPAVAASRPQIGFGMGNWGGNVGTSVGVSVPVGQERVNTPYTADMVLTDVASGKVMWTANVQTPASRDVNAQVAELAKSGLEAAQKAGVF